MADIFTPGMRDWLDKLNQLAEGQLLPIQPDWNAAPGSVKEIKNKPVLAAVATSGSKADVGLGAVDNTADADKPVSTEQKAALDLKASINSTGMKNRIHNGCMRVAQRGISGASVWFGISLDRWHLISAGTAVNWEQRPLDIDGKLRALTWAGAAGNTYVQAQQRIEAINCQDMAGTAVVLSFLVYQSTGASRSIAPQLGYSTGAEDSWQAITFIPSLDPVATIPNAAWTRVTARFAVPAAATTGLAVFPIGANAPLAFGAGQEGGLANVQLEIANTATPLERRPYSLELSLCQYYYRRDAFGHNVVVGTGQAYSTDTAYVLVPLSGAMRVSPTLSFSGALSRLGGEMVTGPDQPGYGPSGLSIRVGYSTTRYVAGDAVMLMANGSFTVIRIAEL
ncbi:MULTISPECIES: hypothetical protein [unclassified Janthinobacterium]|uniref:hypothetical protein n=1 Tax=unclassified Janthinobacterium TaxID=2610881 RepID=UPI0018CB230B|nr:hypothetical protein [Janthinobacterium sp. CG_23.4]MDH6157446.1 hypothetical protein [Janthinobacterium sp. CG_23.4]